MFSLERIFTKFRDDSDGIIESSSFINPKKFKFDSNRKCRNVRSIVTNRIIQNYHLFASCESCSILFAIRSILSLIFDRIGKFIVIRIKNRDIFFFFFFSLYARWKYLEGMDF